MGRMTYYSPLLLGMVLVFVLNESVRAAFPLAEAWRQWLYVTAGALAVGLECQLLMVAAQGAFAQVLPVPFGKSVRGRGAVLAGWLFFASSTLGAAAWLLGGAGARMAMMVLIVLSLVALGGSVAAYVWNLPAALVDFGADERR